MKKLLLLLLIPFSLFSQKNLVVHLTTDNYPSETYWILMKDSLYGDTIASTTAGYYTSTSTSHTDTVVVADSVTNVTFLIRDTYGDGIASPGSFYVTLCQDTIISVPTPNFNTGMFWNRQIPTCAPQPPPLQMVPAKVIINLDQYQSETSWDIKDTNGVTHASGSNYNAQPDYATVVIPVQIPKGPLVFTIYDTYGDGLNGSLWQGQDGSYYLKQCNDTLIYGTDPAFGNDTSHVFISDSCPPILGCTDNDYIEWNPFADVDDGSCQTLKIFGCVDSTMYNYDPSANTMELIDTCVYTLVLHDLMGNGWVGSHLKLIHPDTSYEFTHTGGFNDVYYVGLTAPDPVTFRFHISSQASLTTIECGFTFINPEGDTLISIQPPFIQPLLPYHIITNCGNTCEEKVFGCLDSLAINYDSVANTSDSSCYYMPGCTNSSYLEYYTQGFVADYNDGSCLTQAVWGCTDSTAFNYDTTANIDNGGCTPVINGCMESLAFNYNPLANTPDTCVAYLYGCTDPTMFNYNPLANSDDGSCVEFVYGCTDTIMFNFNPLANAEYTPSNCVPYIYGCTDPSMLNYNPDANTENFSCVEYVYGCMDSAALNYDSTANTDNGSCVQTVQGCMDQSAYNYDISANVHDSTVCLYAASCATGPGNPYWLNDPCYEWVILVDEYCCENEWDTICQATYNHCEGTWVGPLPKRFDKELLMVTDILGRPTKPGKNKVLFFIYSDGTVEKKITK